MCACKSFICTKKQKTPQLTCRKLREKKDCAGQIIKTLHKNIHTNPRYCQHHTWTQTSAWKNVHQHIIHVAQAQSLTVQTHTDVRKTSVPSPGTREDQLWSLSESIVTQLLLWGLRVYRFKDYINLEMNILSVWEVRKCVFFSNASVWKSFLQLNGVIKGNNCCLHTESLHFIFNRKAEMISLV